jgi:addiction module HigA family antidote
MEVKTMARKLPPLHPGEVLREEFLVPLELSAGALARVCGVPRTRIERLANEETGVTADTALRLSKAFGTTAVAHLASCHAVEKLALGTRMKSLWLARQPALG